MTERCNTVTGIVSDTEYTKVSYGDPEFLLIQPTDSHDREVIDSEIRYISERHDNFMFVYFNVKDWNRDLSPWDAPMAYGKDRFGPGAEHTLRFILDNLIPEVSGEKDLPVLLGGYSLAGLFSLYSGYVSGRFTGIAAVSPSLWINRWDTFSAKEKILCRNVYLSLGDREEITKNAMMKQVGDRVRQQDRILEEQGTDHVLEWNEGNHFKEPDIRTAKGFVWLLDHLK